MTTFLETPRVFVYSSLFCIWETEWLRLCVLVFFWNPPEPRVSEAMTKELYFCCWVQMSNSGLFVYSFIVICLLDLGRSPIAQLKVKGPDLSGLRAQRWYLLFGPPYANLDLLPVTITRAIHWHQEQQSLASSSLMTVPLQGSISDVAFHLNKKASC